MLHSWRSWVFLLLTFSSLIPLVLAGTATADDTDAGMFYSGLWVPDGDPNTFGHHDTWTNQSGASVTFDFIGTQIQVFATRRPPGQYLTNVSFSIDGGPPTLWTTSDFLPEITYQNLVYTSPSLSPSQHHITITNFGAIFWLDYVRFANADTVPPNRGGGGDTAAPSSKSTSTPSTKTPPTSSSPPPTSNRVPPTTNQAQQVTSATASSTSESSITPTALGTSQTSQSSGITPDSNSASSDESFSAASSQSTTSESTGTALAAPESAASKSSSHSLVIVGIVVAAVVLIVLVLAALWWLRMRSRKRAQLLPEMTFSTASELGISADYSSKDRPPPNPPRTLHSTDNLLAGHDPASYDGISVINTLGLTKIQEDRTSSARFPGMSSILRSGGPDGSRPFPRAPGHNAYGTSPSAGGSTVGTRISFTSAAASGSHTSSGLAFGPTARTVRHSRDAGIRLAGGPLGDANPPSWGPVAYEEVETLPPSYAQIHGH